MTNLQEVSDVRNETIEAFHLMWDSFPYPVTLLRKCRDIIAINKQAQEMGRPTNGRCYQVSGGDEIHAGCKANQAVEEGIAQRTVRYNKDANQIMDAYWLPVSEDNDLYLHFAVKVDLDQFPIDHTNVQVSLTRTGASK